uniref:HK97 gp10 family phage protein n=1 Tax=Escherichia coli TaxID=562 RepID=UPI0013C4DC21
MSFALDVSKFVEKAKKNPEKVMRQVSIKLFSAIIKASPVDTGRFRMNWMASGGTPAAGTTDATDKSGNTATGNATSFVLKAPDWREFTLTNNLPYAQRLEYGWSQQATHGIISTNVARFQKTTNEKATKVK